MLYYILTIYVILFTHHLCYIIYSPFMLYHILIIYVILYTHHLVVETYYILNIYAILYTHHLVVEPTNNNSFRANLR